jgi:hypothetical protein
MKFNRNQKGWSRNWSERGIAIINNMETAFEPRYYSNAKEKNLSSYKERLTYLCKKFPDKMFYHSLAAELKINKSLNANQVRCIHSDFKKHFRRETNHF